MDAAIDHFGEMGYPKADVCSVVNKLLKVYGKDGWSFLEDGCYLVVQEALLEMQEEVEKLQLQVLPEQQLEQYEDDDGGRDEEEEAQLEEEKLQLQVLPEQQLEQHGDDYGGGDYEEEAQLELLQAGVEEEDHPLELMQAEEEDEPLELEEPQQEEVEENNESQGPQHEEVEENDEVQHQEAGMMEEPLEDFIPIAMVLPYEIVLAVEQIEEVVPMPVHPPSPRVASPDLASTGTKRTRRPCYGWISDSESDSDYEEYLAHRQLQVHVPAK